jgi:midasin (ATPase involved in ribosome maturation)
VSQKKSQDSYSIPDSTVFRILEAHQMIFSHSADVDLCKFQDLWINNFKHGYEIMAHLIAQSGKYYPVEIDYLSQTASAFMSSFYTKNGLSEGLYDFYSNPDVEEANLVVSSVRKFAARLKLLLSEFPDHHVLQHLNSFCEKIVKLPIGTPIMKLLNGIEILLQKSQDWESYAHKNVSLSTEIANISSCIVRLRKKELYSWKDIFAIERRKSSVKAAKLWVNLWDMIIIPLLNPMSEVLIFY